MCCGCPFRRCVFDQNRAGIDLLAGWGDGSAKSHATLAPDTTPIATWLNTASKLAYSQIGETQAARHHRKPLVFQARSDGPPPLVQIPLWIGSIGPYGFVDGVFSSDPRWCARHSCGWLWCQTASVLSPKSWVSKSVSVMSDLSSVISIKDFVRIGAQPRLPAHRCEVELIFFRAVYRTKDATEGIPAFDLDAVVIKARRVVAGLCWGRAARRACR